ncbi:hypothetical protein ABT008_29595 [Micromonospora sp. NPDC002389]|uniref:hypothetical protein n=1 Tax=Micromonospora sp. NPDC002389 TaxID=3154272 RepID=UPI003325E40A
MSAKWSVTPIIKKQLSTLVDQNDPKQRPRLGDYLGLFGVPLTLATAAFFTEFRLRGVEGLLAGVAIFTALLFGLLVHVFTLGLRITDDPRISKSGKTAQLVDQLQGNVAYAVLVGLFTTTVLIVGVSTTLKDHALGVPISTVTVFSICHLLLIMLMALKRTQAAYEQFRL